MSKYYLIFLIFLLSFTYAENMYNIDSGTYEFNVSKQIILQDSGNSIEIRFLSYTNFSDSQILQANEKIVDSQGHLFYPKYELDSYGNKYCVFEINNPDKNLQFEGYYKVKTNSKLLLDETLLITGEDDFSKNSTLILSDTENIVNLSNSIKSDKFYKTIFELDNWIKKNIKYEIRQTFVSGDVYSSEEMYQLKKGFCVEHANLAAAVLRNKGIPARIVVGIAYTGNKWGMHAWLELKHPNGEWISYDPTYHELGFLSASHIKQGVFRDYTEVKDTIKADFSLDNVIFKLNEDPLDINVIELDSESVNTNIQLIYPKVLPSDSDFNICVVNTENNLIIAPIKIMMHPDFKLNINELIYLDSENCYKFKVPETTHKTEYGYYIEFLDKDINDLLVVESSLPIITIKDISSIAENDSLQVIFNIDSDKNLEIGISSDGKFNEIQYFNIIRGQNNIEYNTILDDENVITLTINYNEFLLHNVKINISQNNVINNTPDSKMIYYIIFGVIILFIFVIILLFKQFK